MKVIYPFDQTALDQNPVLGAQNNFANKVFGSIGMGDTSWTLEPRVGTDPFEMPAFLLRDPAIVGSGIQIPSQSGANGPHEDFLFMRNSMQYTYTTRTLISTGVVEKVMSVGAKIGDQGRMILYKGCTTLSDAIVGNWSERLIRIFIVTAADIANRKTGWPSSGSVPTISATLKQIVDGGGDGYNHV